jgi:hypothetical protein
MNNTFCAEPILDPLEGQLEATENAGKGPYLLGGFSTVRVQRGLLHRRLLDRFVSFFSLSTWLTKLGYRKGYGHCNTVVELQCRNEKMKRFSPSLEKLGGLRGRLFSRV